MTSANHRSAANLALTSALSPCYPVHVILHGEQCLVPVPTALVLSAGAGGNHLYNSAVQFRGIRPAVLVANADDGHGCFLTQDRFWVCDCLIAFLIGVLRKPDHGLTRQLSGTGLVFRFLNTLCFAPEDIAGNTDGTGIARDIPHWIPKQ